MFRCVELALFPEINRDSDHFTTFIRFETTHKLYISTQIKTKIKSE